MILWQILIGAVGAALVAALGLAISARLRQLWHQVQRVRIKHYLLRHPEAGELCVDGSYRFRRGPYTVCYYYHPDLRPPHHILWLTTKQRVSPWERLEKSWLRRLQTVCSKEGLAELGQWRTGGLLLAALLLVLLLTEPEGARLRRAEWLLAQLLRVPASAVHVDPSGWIAVTGVRRTEVDRAHEPVTLLVHPLRWLAGRNSGYVVRYRGEPYDYVAHPLRFDGEHIWLHKEGTWHQGSLEGNRVVWAHPEGTGIREGAVRVQQLTRDGVSASGD